ncbi:3-beta hydroxysteroid dehydrogenase [Ophiostoma piceae UAMH 11346]|uniref:3-beta hydroxysteroid dehydrogenase n=1 Tax=Ophiostoma piceae (strain UAMH 11346) TaxID=1262450 RepID=S3CCL6_OPHP1|nr:3-beta hydroxysteroid dehydrogenase [Ophiostoma piceae UAMH 11346]
MAPAEKLLMTGITGYIGFQTLIIALERGYAVRGVVRSDKSIATLQSQSRLIAKSQGDGSLEFVVVPNFLDTDGITEAMNGVSVVVHIASPLATQPEDGDYEHGIVAPAVSMVTVILEAAATTPSVRRVIITSSCVTLIPFEWNYAPDSERLYTADDINASPKKHHGSAMEAYWASKALARMATRNFVRERNPQFDFVHLLPSVVIGPDTRLSADSRPCELTVEARGSVMAPALTASLNSDFPFVGVPVHVHDVARAHIDAVNSSRVPGNTEYILSSDTPDGVDWDRDIEAIARKYFASEVERKTLPLQGSLATIKWRLDASRTEQVFGWRMTSFEQTMKQLLAQYLQLKERWDTVKES